VSWAFSFIGVKDMRLRVGSLRQWHWISSALGLVGILFFAGTGITLNHAEQLESKPSVVTRQLQLPSGLVAQPDTELSGELVTWMENELGISLLAAQRQEWTDAELRIDLQTLKGEASIVLDAASGVLRYEQTDQGWVAFLNNLHTNRHASLAWSWFIDVFAATCLFFSLSGLLILKRHASGRLSTWPLIGLGLITPLLLVVFFFH